MTTLCDRCQKHTYLRAVKGTLELNFCRHHGIEYNRKLQDDGFVLHWDVEGISHLAPGIKVSV